MLSNIPGLGDPMVLRVIENTQTIEELVMKKQGDCVLVVIETQACHHLYCQYEDHHTDVGCQQNRIVKTDANKTQHGQDGSGDTYEEEEDGDVDKAVVEEVKIILVEKLGHQATQKNNHTENLRG